MKGLIMFKKIMDFIFGPTVEVKAEEPKQEVAAEKPKKVRKTKEALVKKPRGRKSKNQTDFN